MSASKKHNADKIKTPGVYMPSLEKDAWSTLFFIENHLDYYGYPEMVASPEQVGFMVYTKEDERYYPCDDCTFEAIINRNRPAFLKQKYNQILKKILSLIDKKIEEEKEKKFLEYLIKIKFDHETRDCLMIPARLEKRLLRIFLNWSQIEDPWLYEKGRRNQRAYIALQSRAFGAALNHVDQSAFIKADTSLSNIKEAITHLELKRLLSMTTENSLWESDAAVDYSETDYLKLFNRKMNGNGVDPLFRFLGIGTADKSQENDRSKKILWLANEAGELMIDFAIIRYLTKLGHKIIIAFKEGPLYTQVDFRDAIEDPVFEKELDGAFLITEDNMAKNTLVNILTSDSKFFALSDGTREDLNLLLASTTFARIFREVDGVISRGLSQKRCLFDTHFQFTQDIFNISNGKNKSVSISYKPRHPAVIKFSHKVLENKAKSIVEQMETAKRQGMTVIFYSAIIGSIPGKIQTAKKIIAVFINYLNMKFDKTFFINPSEYYEPGMDADDLMYMWEIVQGSGFIDIWRFQTYEDIAQAFQIMKKKVPPEWVGKDATYSTGCTKEMKIALDVQQRHPEMQIIGPSKEKFMRREEYGIGKMFDKRLT